MPSPRISEKLTLRLARLGLSRHRWPYLPLNTERQEIRLLKVKPRSRASKQPYVECSILRASLLDKPSYQTVSYCWGDASQRSSVILDGRLFDVPASAAKALTRLRDEDQELTIWIDAICIDQDNDEERAQQVGQMYRVYGASTGNIVYLGDDIGEVDLECVIQNIHDLVSEFQSSAFYREPLKFRHAFSSTPWDTQLDTRSLTAFFSLPWFSRLWVVQETVLAPRNICLCGSKSIDLQDILDAARWMQHNNEYLPRLLGYCRGRRNASEMWTVLKFHAQPTGRPSREYRMSLGALLGMATGLDASEPRDRVYGFLGLVEPQRFHVSLQSLLIPDYKKPLADVYRDATRSALQENNELSFLAMVRHRSEGALVLNGFCSWVPLLHRAKNSNHDNSTMLQVFDASGGSVVKWEENSDSNILCIKGITLDSVMAKSPVWTWNSIYKEAFFNSMLGTILDMLAEATHTTENDGFDEALARTLLMIAKLPGAPREESPPSVSLLQQYLFRKSHNSDLSKAQVSSAGDQYVHSFRRACEARRFFVTKSGHIGLGPKATTEGDIVAVMYGGETPYILRPCENGEYQFLGEAYVDGIMHGEAVQAHHASGRADFTFSIR